MSESVAPRPPTTDPTEDQPGDRRSHTKEQAREVAEHGSQQAKEVAGTAREGMSEVAREASRQTSRLVDETMGQLRAQAGEQTHRVGGALHTLGERLEALADGEPEKAGALGEYAQQFAGQTHEIAQKIDELGFEGVARELTRFARRRPGAFLLSAAVAGLATARLGRGVAESEDEGGASSRQDPLQREPVRVEGVTHDDRSPLAVPANEVIGERPTPAAAPAHAPSSPMAAPDAEIRR